MMELSGKERRINLALDKRQMTPMRLKFLKDEQQRELSKLRAQAEAASAAANERGDAAFEEASKQVAAAGAKASGAKAFHESLAVSAQRRMSDGWDALQTLTGSDHIRGVLEYWEEHEEVREALEESREARYERKDGLLRERNRLFDERALERDQGYAERVAYDESVEQIGAAMVHANATVRKARRKCERLDELLGHVHASLGKAAAVCTRAPHTRCAQIPAGIPCAPCTVRAVHHSGDCVVRGAGLHAPRAPRRARARRQFLALVQGGGRRRRGAGRVSRGDARGGPRGQAKAAAAGAAHPRHDGGARAPRGGFRPRLLAPHRRRARVGLRRGRRGVGGHRAAGA